MAQWVPPPLPAELIARRRGPLVGRAAELAAFEQAWERVESGNRQAVFIGGEPGAGKTRLAAEVAGTLFDHGVAVLVGSSTADADVPYAPFAEALDRLLIGRSRRVRWPNRWPTRDRSCAGCRPMSIGICPTPARPTTSGTVAARPFRRADRLSAAPGGRPPDRVDPRRPALGAAAHARDARTRADRLRRCAHAGGGHVPHDRARPLRRAGHPAGRTAPVRRCAAPGSRRAWTPRRSPSSSAEPSSWPSASARTAAALLRDKNRRQPVLPDRTVQRPGNRGAG